MRAGFRVRDLWCLLLTVVFGALIALNVLAVVVIAIRGPRVRLWVAPVAFLIDYWFMMGAWLRTSWGRPAPDGPLPPGPPQMSARNAMILIALAGACVLAAGIALAIQLHEAGY